MFLSWRSTGSWDLFGSCSAFCITLSAVFACGLMATADSAEDASARPLVIGFERFARHQEIPAEQAGALLLSELSCTACHATQLKSLEPKAGPKLESAGRRLRAAWLRAYLNAPAKIKPGTTMPDVLTGVDPGKREAVIEALVSFLATQQAPLPEPKASGAVPVPHEFWNKGDAAAGKTLMHQRGCVTCHEPAADLRRRSAGEFGARKDVGGLRAGADSADGADACGPNHSLDTNGQCHRQVYAARVGHVLVRSGQCATLRPHAEHEAAHG